VSGSDAVWGLLQDPETYIHRSGRTGRANSTGVSVTLVDRKKEGLIPFIAKRAGVTFERIGAPQPSEMARIAGAATTTRLCSPSQYAWEHDTILRYTLLGWKTCIICMHAFRTANNVGSCFSYLSPLRFSSGQEISEGALIHYAWCIVMM
jgi:hypothetical protein